MKKRRKERKRKEDFLSFQVLLLFLHISISSAVIFFFRDTVLVVYVLSLSLSLSISSFEWALPMVPVNYGSLLQYGTALVAYVVLYYHTTIDTPLPLLHHYVLYMGADFSSSRREMVPSLAAA